MTSYVANGNDKINEEQDSSASLQNHFTPKEKYYMDLKTTVSSVDASEVTFVQDKTLLVAVKGQFSSSLGEERGSEKRTNFSQTFLLTTGRGGCPGRGQQQQHQQQQQQQQPHQHEFVCTNELLQLSCDHHIDKVVGTRDASTSPELYGDAMKMFEIERQKKHMVQVPPPPSTPKPMMATPRKHRYQERQHLMEVPKPLTPPPPPRPTGGVGRRASFGAKTTKHEIKFIEKQIDALHTEKGEKTIPPPVYNKPLGDLSLVEAKQQLLVELKQKKKPTRTAIIKQNASSHVVFVKNIHFHTPVSAMRRAFSVYGTIISIDFGFPKDDFGEERKKFCFIQYASHSECEEAVARSTNVSIDGCRLIVQHRNPKG